MKLIWQRLMGRRPRMWEPTGEYRVFWEMGGTVTLDGEQVDRLSGKHRWTRARWLPLDEYREILNEKLAAELESK